MNGCLGGGAASRVRGATVLRMREAFDLPGVPLRLRLRTGKNPYV